MGRLSAEDLKEEGYYPRVEDTTLQRRLLVKNYIEKRTVDLKAAIVLNKA